MGISAKIKGNAFLKKMVHWALVPKNQARPRLWVKWFVNPFYHKKGSGSCIRRRTRIDVLPWNIFELGSNSTIEDFTTVNNGVGPVIIGNQVRIGLGNTLIGPVTVKDGVRLAQNVVLSGLNHNYEDINLPIHAQGVSTAMITIMEETWVGANVVIVAGVTVGKHCIIAGGSVVTKNIPDYSVAVGNPAKVIKQYSPLTGKWESTAPKQTALI